MTDSFMRAMIDIMKKSEGGGVGVSLQLPVVQTENITKKNVCKTYQR